MIHKNTININETINTNNKRFIVNDYVFEIYFLLLLKLDPELRFVCGYKDKDALTKITDIYDINYTNKLEILFDKFISENNDEISAIIKIYNYEKKHKLYLYDVINSSDNFIIDFEYSNKYIYPKSSDYEKKRRINFHIYISSIVKLLKEGIENKITVPSIIVAEFIKQVKNIPNYHEYKYFVDYINNKYLPLCRNSIGLSDCKNGKKIYSKILYYNLGCVKYEPEWIHTYGLSKIQNMKIKNINKYNDINTLLKDCNKYCKHIYKNVIEKYFYYVPETLYKIKQSNDENDTNVMYFSILENTIYINPKYVQTFTKESLYTLMMHEIIHQYHNNYLEYYNVPKYKIYGYDNLALSEGFATYMETYCDDNIIDEDIYHNSNNDYTLLKYLRLVIDTGIHYYNWSYKSAFDFMKKYIDNDQIIKNEITRYICDPTDSLCYIIGMLEIQKLKTKFMKLNTNIKDFHDFLLINGYPSFKTLNNYVDDIGNH